MIRSETNEVGKRVENRKTIKPKGGSLKKKKNKHWNDKPLARLTRKKKNGEKT